MTDEKTPQLTKEQQEMMDKMNKAKLVLDSVNKQRKSALDFLKRKANNLLTNEKLDMENLGTAVMVDAMREITQATNSALLVMESHDKLIDMFINDLVGCLSMVKELRQEMYEASVSVEMTMRALMKNGVLTEEQLKVCYSEIMAEFQKNQEQSKQESKIITPNT